jgi:hypothetical protein
MSKHHLMLPALAFLVSIAFSPSIASNAMATTKNTALAATGNSYRQPGDPYNTGYAVGYDDGLDCSEDRFNSSKREEWQEGYWDGHAQGSADADC